MAAPTSPEADRAGREARISVSRRPMSRSSGVSARRPEKSDSGGRRRRVWSSSIHFSNSQRWGRTTDVMDSTTSRGVGGSDVRSMTGELITRGCQLGGSKHIGVLGVTPFAPPPPLPMPFGSAVQPFFYLL